MNRSKIALLEKIFVRLGFDITKIETNLCKLLNHRELLYVYAEICRLKKKNMPYENMKSSDSIIKWLDENP